METESYKYNPDMSDVPRPTSNIPIVETKTHKVTYEKDGIPYETEDSVLVSAHSVTTKSQTIDTTTVSKNGMINCLPNTSLFYALNKPNCLFIIIWQYPVFPLCFWDRI